MKAYKLFTGMTALIALTLTGCASSPVEDLNQEEITNDEDIFVEAPKCDGTVTVRVLEGSRASSAIDPTIDRLTATRCDVEDGTFTLVSYHGRNKEEIGMVQVINRNTNTVVSELYFEDARVNYCAYYNKYNKQVAYVGVDRTDKENSNNKICGIVAIPMKNGKFDIDNQPVALQPYFVEGVSVNCIKFVEQTSVYNKSFESAMVVASGGNNALERSSRMAGFTKFKINKEQPTTLTQPVTGANTMLKENFRGYWISFNKETDIVKQPVAYTYRTTEGKDLVYKLAVVTNDDRTGLGVFDFFDAEKPFGEPDAEVEVMRRYGTEDKTAEDLGRFSVSMMVLNTARFLIVSTGSKVLDSSVGSGGGVRVYRLDHNNGNPRLVEVDVWNKACYNTSNKNTKLSDGPYIYASCAETGLFKCKIEYDPAQKSAQTMRIVPVEKRKTSILTESDTYASTNYVQCNLDMTKIHVAGGYEGYYTLDLNDSQFVPADPRESYE